MVVGGGWVVVVVVVFDETKDQQGLIKRRVKLCLKFALKLENNPKFSNWFVRNQNTHLRNPRKYIKPYARTNKYYNSSILCITRMLIAKQPQG